MLGLPFPAEVRDVELLHESLGKQVGRADLERPAVRHHGLVGVGPDASGKFLALGFHSADSENRPVLTEILRIDLEHDLLCESVGFRLGFVESVSFLPIEFGRPQEWPGALLPPHHIHPLVRKDRQIAIAIELVAEVLAEHGLRGGPDGELLLKLFPSPVSDDRKLGRESFDMLLLPLEERHRDEQGQQDIADS